MGGSDRFDQLLKALADGYRRELLLALIKHNPQDDDDSDPLHIERPEGDNASEFDIFMYHLPMLEQVGIIEWDRENDEIVKGPDWEEFLPLLELIANHADELPEDWFSKPEQAGTAEEFPEV